MTSCSVAIIGTHDEGYTRFRSLAEALNRLGYNTVSRTFRTGCRAARVGRSIVAAWRLAPSANAIVVTYPAHLAALPIVVVGRLRRRPVIVDSYISLYETRGLDQAGHKFKRRSLKIYEAVLAHLAAVVVLDTPVGALAMAARTGRVNITYIPITSSTEFVKLAEREPVRPRTIFWYGNSQPLNGFGTLRRIVLHLIRERSDVRVVVVGHTEFLQGLTDPKLLTYERLTTDELLQEMRRATVALGIFGGSDKADHVIPNKVVDALALDVPVVTRASSALRGVESPAIQLVPAGDAQAAVAAIDRLLDGPQLAESPREAYERYFSLDNTASRLQAVLRQVGALDT